MCKPALNTALAILHITLFFFAGTHRAEAQTYKVLYTFSGADGAGPAANLTMDAAGTLYGTAGGGTSTNCNGGGCGTVFKIDTSGKETVLHSFNNTDGSTPFTSVTLDAEGNIYGATSFGGTGNPPSGVVFKIDTKGNYKVLHDFPKSRPTDGLTLQFATLLRDPAGNLYGSTMLGGGTECGGKGCGTVFKIDSKGRETITSVNFDPSAPYDPSPTSIIRDAQGNIYGTTLIGGGTGCGGTGCGTVFKVDTKGKVKLLHSFQGAPDGATPVGSLTFDRSGNLYGTTMSGGDAQACPSAGCGTIFKISPTGKETIFHAFEGSDGELAFWEGGLVFDPKGNLYGVANAGGTIGAGTIFKIDVKGKIHVLYNFTDGTDGGFPMAGLIRDKAGDLYGTTSQGGNTNGQQCFPVGCGAVFKLTP